MPKFVRGVGVDTSLRKRKMYVLALGPTFSRLYTELELREEHDPDYETDDSNPIT